MKKNLPKYFCQKYWNLRHFRDISKNNKVYNLIKYYINLYIKTIKKNKNVQEVNLKNVIKIEEDIKNKNKVN